MSAKSRGPSLNECMCKGPQMTSLIFDILVRFRIYSIAVTLDIEKAFFQIGINRDYPHFLWFDDVFSDPPR